MAGQRNGAGGATEQSRRLDRVGLGLILFVVLFAVAMIAIGHDEAMAALGRVHAGGFLVLCALAGAHYLLRALRWHLLVRAGGIAASPGQSARHFFGGFAMTATPGRLGELVRLRWLSRETGIGLARLVPVALADRVIELASMLLLIAAALMATGLGSGAVWWLFGVACVLVAVACRPRALETAITGLWRLGGRRGTRHVVRARRVARRLAPFMRPPVFGPALLIGAVGWGFEALAFWLLLGWLGAALDPATAAAIFLVALLAGALSGLPGGLGGTEATAVALLLLQGVPAETAIVATAVIRIATLWFALGIGLAVFPVAEARAARAAAA